MPIVEKAGNVTMSGCNFSEVYGDQTTYNGSVYNGPVYHGPMYNRPVGDAPVYYGDVHNGPGYNGAAYYDDDPYQSRGWCDDQSYYHHRGTDHLSRPCPISPQPNPIPAFSPGTRRQTMDPVANYNSPRRPKRYSTFLNGTRQLGVRSLIMFPPRQPCKHPSVHCTPLLDDI